MSDLFKGYGVEIDLVIDPTNPDKEAAGRTAFLKVKETLTRIGISSKKDKSLFQTCHIFHKQGHYAIMHFKEMFAYDGRSTNFSEDDKARRNTIVNRLVEWNLVKLKGKQQLSPVAPGSYIKIIKFEEKEFWNLEQKYNVGRKIKET